MTSAPSLALSLEELLVPLWWVGYNGGGVCQGEVERADYYV
jgi:hypothetical protein